MILTNVSEYFLPFVVAKVTIAQSMQHERTCVIKILFTFEVIEQGDDKSDSKARKSETARRVFKLWYQFLGIIQVWLGGPWLS